jgi:hypothetical protein
MPFTQNNKELRTVLDNISGDALFLDGKGIIRVDNGTLSEMLSMKGDITGAQTTCMPGDWIALKQEGHMQYAPAL